MPETIEKPQEVWLSFFKNTYTGKTVLRQRIIKVIDAPKNIVFVTDASDGQMQSWTLLQTDIKGINKRVGKLIWKRD